MAKGVGLILLLGAVALGERSWALAHTAHELHSLRSALSVGLDEHDYRDSQILDESHYTEVGRRGEITRGAIVFILAPTADWREALRPWIATSHAAAQDLNLWIAGRPETSFSEIDSLLSETTMPYRLLAINDPAQFQRIAGIAAAPTALLMTPLGHILSIVVGIPPSDGSIGPAWESIRSGRTWTRIQRFPGALRWPAVAAEPDGDDAAPRSKETNP